MRCLLSLRAGTTTLHAGLCAVPLQQPCSGAAGVVCQVWGGTFFGFKVVLYEHTAAFPIMEMLLLVRPAAFSSVG